MITFKQYLLMEDETIVSAVQKDGGFIYVYGNSGLLCTIATSGKLLGFTTNNINVADNGFLYIYDAHGTIINMLPEGWEGLNMEPKVHFNSNINQAKALAKNSEWRQSRFVVMDSGEFRCGDAKDCVHENLHKFEGHVANGVIWHDPNDPVQPNPTYRLFKPDGNSSLPKDHPLHKTMADYKLELHKTKWDLD